MAWSLLAHTVSIGAGGSITTGSIDTTGAKLIVIAMTATAQNVTPTDSKSNTWVRGPHGQSSSSNTVELWYCVNPTVGTGHTFTNGGSAASIAVQAWSGPSASPFDQSSATNTGTSPGSITPSVANALVVAAESIGGATGDPTAASGMTVSDHGANNGSAFGVGIAYVVQTSAAAINPTWTLSGGGTGSSVIASFKPDGAYRMFAVF